MPILGTGGQIAGLAHIHCKLSGKIDIEGNGETHPNRGKGPKGDLETLYETLWPEFSW